MSPPKWYLPPLMYLLSALIDFLMLLFLRRRVRAPVE